ncbi:MAG: Phenylacetic acid catabolic protein, partial [Candidatus Limnocylindrales bacterium]
KLRREERYHRMHLVAWIDRLARGGPQPRRRLESALAALGPDASSVFTPLADEPALIEAGILTRTLVEAEAAWRADLSTVLVPLGLPVPPHASGTEDARRDHSESFRWLWGEFTAVRRSEDGATW